MSQWVLRHSSRFRKSLSKLDPPVQQQIAHSLERIVRQDNPRILGSELSGNLSGFWRYRVGNYRIIAEIVDEDFIVIAIDVGHRSRIYRSR